MELGNGLRRASQVEPLSLGNHTPAHLCESFVEMPTQVGQRNQAHASQILQHPDRLVSQGVRVLFSFRMLWSSADRTIQVQRDATSYRTPAMFVFRMLMSAPRAVCPATSN